MSEEKCPTCGSKLEMGYACNKPEGYPAVKEKDNLVCKNDECGAFVK